MRGNPAPKRPIQPDIKFDREEVAKFIFFFVDKRTLGIHRVHERREILLEPRAKTVRDALGEKLIGGNCSVC